MMKRAAAAFLLVALFGRGFAEEAKPKVSKTAPRLEGTAEPDLTTVDPGAAPAKNLPAPADTKGFAREGQSLSMDVEAPTFDELPIEMDPPPFDVPFRNVVGFARPGQIEKVLNGPVEHMPANEILSLAVLSPRQVQGALPIRLPEPPFVRMEVPRLVSAGEWVFSVMDQSGQVVHEEKGSEAPRDLAVWDGFRDGLMRLRAGVAYTPLFSHTDPRGGTQGFFGEPIQLDVMQFVENGFLRVEMSNNRLFQAGSAELEPEAAPLLQAVLDVLRANAGGDYRVTVFSEEGGKALAVRRVQTLSLFLSDALVLEPNRISFGTGSGELRGDVTQFLLVPAPGEARR